MKREKSQPEDTTGKGGSGSSGISKEGFKPHKSGDNKAGNAPRQDGKNSKAGTESHDGLWLHKHSTTQGPIQA
jgi:hypothetical protein